MTNPLQPDEPHDAASRPAQENQHLLNKLHQEQLHKDVGQDLPTVMPSSAENPGNQDSGTVPVLDMPTDKIVLEGDSVPGYDLLGELGRGGMGVVYKARNQKLKRIVALKMILSGTHASDEEIHRFQTEAEAVARLQHPNIVQIYEVAEHGGRPYIALEFVDGGSLDQKISGTPQNARESARLVETLARAIQQAHDNEIIHRDLKPANILLTVDGDPRITDFGLAKRLDEDSGQTKSGAVMGTPSYMAPEQAASTIATLGPAADTYALGAILYHMLTGRPPFQAETQLDTIMQVIADEPVAPRKLIPTLPVDLETICLKCLEKDIHRRYASAEALAEDLRRFQEGEPIEARPVSVVLRGLKWARRRPAVAGLSAAVVVILIAGMAISSRYAVMADREATAAKASADHAKKNLADKQKAEDDRRIAQANALRQATPQAAAVILQELKSDFGEVQKSLRALLGNTSLPEIEINRIRLGLLLNDPEQLEPIVQFLLSEAGQQLGPEELLLIRDTLGPYGNQLTSRFVPLLELPEGRLRAACLLARFAPGAEFWTTQATPVTEALVDVLPSELAPYRELLRPVQHHLTTPLSAIYRDDHRGEQDRLFATDILADYLSGNPVGLFNLLIDANTKQFPILFDKLNAYKKRAIQLGNIELSRSASQITNEEEKEALALKQANAAVMLLRINAPDQVWSLLKHSTDLRVRSLIIHRLRPLGVGSRTIIDRYGVEPDVTAKRALLLVLGEFDESQLSPSDLTSLVTTLLGVYRSNTDSGLHAAAEWLLRKWGQGKQVTTIDEQLQQSEQQLLTAGDAPKEWYINSQGQTFVILDAAEFQMGSPESELGQRPNEEIHRRRIGRRFAISTKELTKSQWRVFSEEVNRRSADHERVVIHSRTEDSPMISMTWYEAAWYCNWLSKQEGIAEDQWCFEPDKENGYGPGMKAKDNFLELSGYRLPTESEWEYACRAGTRTSRHYGQAETLLANYAWYRLNSEERTWPVASLKPNDFGLFDMQGNAWEWCYDAFRLYTAHGDETSRDLPGTQKISNTSPHILRGGSFESRPAFVRSAHRNNYRPGERQYYSTGFRPARTYPLSP